MPTFPKAARLRHSLEFRRGFDEGVKVVNPYFILFATASTEFSPKTFADRFLRRFGIRAGFVVSKKVGNAVIRNRVKRILRTAFVTVCEYPLPNPQALPDFYIDLVVLARPGIKDLPIAEIMALLEAGVQKSIQKLSHSLKWGLELGSGSPPLKGANHAPTQ